MTMILKKGINLSKKQINRALNIIGNLDWRIEMHLENAVASWAMAQKSAADMGIQYGDEHSAYMMGRVNGIVETLKWQEEITEAQATLLIDYYTEVATTMVIKPEDVE